MASLCAERVRQVGQIVAGVREKMHVQKKSEDSLLLPGERLHVGSVSYEV